MAFPPYMNATGLISKIFAKIAEAQRPERFTQDYLTNVIGYRSGSGKPIIPLLKRLRFLQSDGTPTQLYTRFRNPSERASAMLEALRNGFPELFARSEYAHHLSREKLRDLVVEVTGLERDDPKINAIVGTFHALKTTGGVDESTKIGAQSADHPLPADPSVHAVPPPPPNFLPRNGQDFGLNVSYTFNLNLPNSTDPEVYL